MKFDTLNSGEMRFLSFLKNEQGEVSESDLFDAIDLIDFDSDAVEAEPVPVAAPVVSPEPPQLLPGQFILIDSLCDKFGKPRGYVLADMDELGSLYAGCPVEEYRIRAAMREKRDAAKRRAALIPARQRRQAHGVQ